MKEIHIAIVAAFVCCQVLCVQSADPSKKDSMGVNKVGKGQRLMVNLNRLKSRVEQAMLSGGIDVSRSLELITFLDRVKVRVEQAIQKGGIDATRGQAIVDLIGRIKETVAHGVPDKGANNEARESDTDSQSGNKQDKRKSEGK